MENLTDINELNIAVNRSIEYSKSAVKWQTREESLVSRAGDCTSYAIAKYQGLRRAGIPARLAYVASKDGPHLVVLTRGMVLDNITDDVLPLSARKDLHLAFTFDEKSVYDGEGNVIGSAETIEGWKGAMQRMGK